MISSLGLDCLKVEDTAEAEETAVTTWRNTPVDVWSSGPSPCFLGCPYYNPGILG